jgi:CobQ-like glutamine amidotransferase family enzyme
MNIYGDMGNIIAIQYRLQKMGYEVVYQVLNQKSDLPKQTDFYFIGGGQDKEQEVIYTDLLNHKGTLQKDVDRGVGLLAICGGYQLLGKSFITGKGITVEGLNIFPIETKSPDASVKSRCIGNLIVQSLVPEIATSTNINFVGFENHGGQTYFTSKSVQSELQKTAYPLGKVLQGFGNNSVEKLEGCVLNAAIGTYLHGSCLPKNPQLADWLIQKSLEAKFRLEKIQNSKFRVKNGGVEEGTASDNNISKAESVSKNIEQPKPQENIDDTISLAVQKSLINRFLG